MLEKLRNPRNALDIALSGTRPLLTCYFPICDPMAGDYIADAYADGGVNIVELGMPTENPRLDGPDIAGSMHRAMGSGIDVVAGFQSQSRALRERAPDIGTICMAYADSPVLARSTRATFEFVDATLILGLEGAQPPAAAGTRTVVFVPARFAEQDIRAAKNCDAYVMLQATDGVTGPRSDVDPANAERIRRLRAAGVQQRILLGFGISTPDQARAAIQMGADGVIIGSMCMRKALEGKRALRDFVRDVRAALDD